MKRLLCILFALVLLTGCGAEPAPTETAAPPTEPSISWVEEFGRPWDAEGALVELPLTIPNGLIYATYLPFDGDLLLWNSDNHRADAPSVSLCLIDLDTGKILAQKDIAISASIAPQRLKDQLYICDSDSGVIVQLDKSLEIVNRWETDIREAAIYMGANGVAYYNKWGEGFYAKNLETGETKLILEEDPVISYLYAQEDYLRVEYYHPDTGEATTAFIDLTTGARHDAPDSGTSGVMFRNGNWLFESYDETMEYCLYPENGEISMAQTGYHTLQLMENDLLLQTGEGSNWLSLHDLTGTALAKCTLSEQEYGYSYTEVIPNERLGGYFVICGDHDGSLRLLFWDPRKGSRGEDIPFEIVPEPSEQEALVRQRIEELETEYGLSIFVGEDAGQYFFDFEAEQVLDWMEIDDALDTMENALSVYPEGFFRQLRYGDIQRTEIHLVGTLTATNAEYTDTYEAFVQESYDCHVMALDIYLSDESTYYHEFSHIIDSFLEWDAMQRTDALFSEDNWCSLNPSWFPGYTYDYSWERYVEDYSCFVDSYSTINPTEDRARVLEYAMVDYGFYTFDGCDVLLEKLDYYCRCIRDAFDTTGWPETVLWEQYL